MKKYIFGALLFLFTAFSFSSSASAATNISACGTLSSPGEYVLTQSIATSSGTCLLIRADGVEIDGNDFTVTGDVNGNGVATSSDGYDFDLSNIVVDGHVFSEGAFGGGDGGEINVTNAEVVGEIDSLGGNSGYGSVVSCLGGVANVNFSNTNAGNGGTINIENSITNVVDSAGGYIAQRSSTSTSTPVNLGLTSCNGGLISIIGSSVQDTGASGGGTSRFYCNLGESGGGTAPTGPVGAGGDIYMETSIAGVIFANAGSVAIPYVYKNAGTIELIDTEVADSVESLDSDGDPDENITVTDHAPTLSLIGPSSLTIYRSSSYSEQGATSTDAKDGALDVDISGSVDVFTSGTYILTYSATDEGTEIEVNGDLAVFESPQSTSTTRTVVVEVRKSGGSGGGGEGRQYKI